MTIKDAVEAVQFSYPQIYYSCHTRHDRRRSTDATLSGRDSQILVHLDRRRATAASQLRRHLGLAASTVSEALTRLERFGYVVKVPAVAGDRRRIGLVLTAKGVAAVRAGSVLETARLAAALRRLSAADRVALTAALDRFVQACRLMAARRQRRADA